jgi:hypothetical protein
MPPLDETERESELPLFGPSESAGRIARARCAIRSAPTQSCGPSTHLPWSPVAVQAAGPGLLIGEVDPRP